MSAEKKSDSPMSNQMSRGGKEEKSSSDEQKAVSILTLNNMLYNAPIKSAVTVKRNLVKHYFDCNEYTSGANVKSAKCTIGAGDSYTWGPNSYLTFKISLANTVKTATFASGSAINVINRLTLTSHSGTEVERVEEVNNLMRDLDRYRCSQEWIDTYGGVMGYNPDTEVQQLVADGANAGWNLKFKKDGAELADFAVDGATANIVAKAQPKVINVNSNDQYCIPLSHICGLFASDKLLPGMGLCSGMRFEIQLETRDVALKWNNTPAGIENYTLSDMAVVLDSYQLADDVLKVLTEQSAKNSLEISFKTWDLNRTECEGTNLNIEAKTAVSRALYAIAKTRVQGEDKSLEDSFIAEEFKVKQYQFKMGGLFWPNQPLTTKYEHYNNAQYCFEKMADCRNLSSVSVPKFLEDQGIMAVLLLRSNVLDASGVAVSGSRILQLRAEYDDVVAGRQVDLYLCYIKLARVFVDRVVVKS